MCHNSDKVRGHWSHCGYHAAFVVRNYVQRGLAGSVLRRLAYCSSDSDSCLSFTLSLTCLSPALPPRRRSGNIWQGSPVQEERTAEEEERHKEERQRGETCQSKEAQEDCKFVQQSRCGFLTLLTILQRLHHHTSSSLPLLFRTVM